jgi:putative membrane protein
MILLFHWLIMALAVLVSAYLLPGVTLPGFGTAILVAMVLGIINVFLKPFLVLLTLPITILTLGLFLLVINTLLIMLTSALVPGFKVDNFWWALLFGLVLSVVHNIFRIMFLSHTYLEM